jgi:hypothetical protein
MKTAALFIRCSEEEAETIRQAAKAERREAVAYHIKKRFPELPIILLSGFSEVPERTLPAPDDAIAPTEPPAVAVRNVHELAAHYGIVFG